MTAPLLPGICGAFHKYPGRIYIVPNHTDFFHGRGRKLGNIRGHQQFEASCRLDAGNRFAGKGIKDAHSLGLFLEIEDPLGRDEAIGSLALHSGFIAGVGAAIEMSGAGDVTQLLVEFLFVNSKASFSPLT